MFFDFNFLRPHLQQNVLQKLNFVEFSRFSQCSHFSVAISKCLNRRLPLDRSTHGLLLSSNKDRISHFLENFPVRIHFSQLKMEITPEDFNRVLKVSHATDLIFVKGFDAEFLCQPAMMHISKLVIKSTAVEMHSFDIFLHLKAVHMDLEQVTFTPKSLNSFFKQWYNGTRQIKLTYITTDFKHADSNHDHVIFSGIPHEFLWSKELHHQSVFRQMALDQMQPLGNHRSFALKRNDAQLHVVLNDDSFSAELVTDPQDACLKYIETFLSTYAQRVGQQ